MAFNWSVPISQPQARGDEAPLTDGSHLLPNTRIPTEWFSGDNLRCLQWNGEHIKLPSNPDPSLFGSIRGQDIPSFPKGRKSSKLCGPPLTKSRGSLVMKADHIAQPMVCGGSNASLEEGQVRFSIQNDTQLPSITLELKQESDDGTIVYHRVIFFGNLSMDAVTFEDPESVKESALDWQIPEVFKKAREEGRLMALGLRFGYSSNMERIHNSILVLHGQDHPDGQDRWEDDAQMIGTFTDKTFTGLDRAVFRMLAAQNLTITFLREFDDKGIPNIQPWSLQYRYWEYVMNLCCSRGQLWYYTMQPGFNAARPGGQLTYWDQPSHPPPVPFWLVRAFESARTASPDFSPSIGRRLSKIRPHTIKRGLTFLTRTCQHYSPSSATSG